MVDDVLIIGAGAAGLTAAYDLFHTDYKVTILEASNLVGGRLKKNDSFTDYPLDLGAEWIHVSPDILDKIIDDPQVVNDVETFSARQKLDEYSKRDGTWDRSTTFRNDYKFKDYTWFDFFNDYIATDVEHLIHFGCQVTEIDWETEPIEAKCASGTVHKAWHVIVTAPLPVLARGDITFKPSLPNSYQNAIQSAGSPENFPNGIKTWLKFSKRFWETPSFAFVSDYSQTGERLFYEAGFGQDSDEYILGVFNQGDTTEEYDGISETVMIHDLLEELTIMFGTEASQTYTGEHFVQNWKNEPFIGGSYSMYHDGYYWPIKTLRRHLGGKVLWFAGEAIPRGNFEWGYAHGAALSGRKAAKKIMAIYGD